MNGDSRADPIKKKVRKYDQHGRKFTELSPILTFKLESSLLNMAQKLECTI